MRGTEGGGGGNSPNKPYIPPYKISQGDVKTNVDRGRAENYKSGKTAPSQTNPTMRAVSAANGATAPARNPTYAQSIRAGYAAAPPEGRRASADKAQARVNLKGPKTFNGMDLTASREDKIVLAEHARRVNQLTAAQQFRNPNNDISADMSTANSYRNQHPEDYPGPGRLQTGQTSFGVRPESNPATRMAAQHPGIETAPDRFVANVAGAINNQLPVWGAGADRTTRLPGDYSKAGGYRNPMSDIKRVDPTGTGGLGPIFGAIDVVSNPNNLLHQAGQLGGNAITAGLGAIHDLPAAGKIATSLIPGGAIVAGLGSAPKEAGVVAGNAFKDAVDVYAQALPSLYQIGDAGVSAAHGDTAKLDAQWKGLKGMMSLQGLHDHPLLVPLMAKGGLSAIGRTGGAIARGAGRAAAQHTVPAAVADAGRAYGPAPQPGAVRAAAQAAGDFASTRGRAPVVLPGKGSVVNRVYSHDVISKHLVERPFDALLARKGKEGGFTQRKIDAMQGAQARRWERKDIQEGVGGNEATRRYHRSQIGHLLSSRLPRTANAVALVPWIARGLVTKPELMHQQLKDLLTSRKEAEQEIKAMPQHDGKNDKLHANQAQQAILQQLIDDKSLTPDSKHVGKAFEAARAVALRQGATDVHLANLAHIGTQQGVRAKAFDFVLHHMGGAYDDAPRPTAQAIMKEGMNAAEHQAKVSAGAAERKLATAEKWVREKGIEHKTIQKRGKVPGGQEKPLVVQLLEQQLHEAEKHTRRTVNQTEGQAYHAGHATGSALVRAKNFDRNLFERDPQAEKLRIAASETSRAFHSAQVRYNNAHGLGKSRGADQLHTDAERHAASSELWKTLEARDNAHSDLHAHLDDVQAAAVRGTTKKAAGPAGRRPTMDMGNGDKMVVNNRISPTTKTEAHYSELGRGPHQSLAKAEVERASWQERQRARSDAYKEERRIRRDLAKAGREADKLKSTDREQLRKLVEERDKRKAEHEQAVMHHAQLRESNKNFKVTKAEFTPGLVDKNGIQLSTEAINAKMIDMGIVGGLRHVAYVNDRPGALFNAGFVSDRKAPYEAPNTRTGEAARLGLGDMSMESLSDSMLKSQGIVDAMNARQRIIDRQVFGKAGGGWYETAEQAYAAARDLSHEGLDVVPYQVTDNRLTSAGREAQQAHFDPGSHPGLARDNELQFDPGQGALLSEKEIDGAPPGNYGLMSKSAAMEYRAHSDVVSSNPAMRGLQEFTQRWRNVVLFSTSMPKWVTGNLAEMMLRMAVAGVGLRSMVVGWRIMQQTVEQAGRPQEAAYIHNYLLGGAHFGGTLARLINFARRNDKGELESGLREAMDRFRHPTVAGRERDMMYLWNQWKRAVNAVNKGAELGAAYGAIGKLALKDRESWGHLNEGWKDALAIGPQAAGHVAKGLLETAEQVRYAQFVYRTIGRYTNLSPKARHIVGNYTPFGLWYVNALKFCLLTIPRHHPLFGSLLSASYLASEQDRAQLKQSLWADNGMPGFLQGSLVHHGYGPSGESSHQYSRYLPFGAFSDLAETAKGQMLPQLRNTLQGLSGTDFKGKLMRRSDGHELTVADRLKFATYVTFEQMVPFMSVTHQIIDRKGQAYIDDYIWSPKTKPGSQVSVGESFKMNLLPGYGYKNNTSTGPSKVGGIPSLGQAIPTLKLPTP